MTTILFYTDRDLGDEIHSGDLPNGICLSATDAAKNPTICVTVDGAILWCEPAETISRFGDEVCMHVFTFGLPGDGYMSFCTRSKHHTGDCAIHDFNGEMIFAKKGVNQ
jgi:hypothetical protein